MLHFEIPRRWADLDAQGHINNVSFVDYLQEARSKFIWSGPLAELLDSGIVVASHSVNYHATTSFNSSPIHVEMGVTALGAAKIEIGYRLSVVKDGNQPTSDADPTSDLSTNPTCHADPSHRAEPSLADSMTTVVTAATTLCIFDFFTQQPRRLTDQERHWFDSQRLTAEPAATKPLPKVSLNGEGHHFPLEVRWSDTDRYGHVNNVRFWDFIQEARIAMTTEAVPAMARAGSDDHEAEYQWVIARQDVQYRRQMAYRQAKYRVDTAPVTISNSSTILNAEIVDPDEPKLGPLATAQTVLVCVDRQTHRKTALPDEIRHTLGDKIVEPGGSD